VFVAAGIDHSIALTSLGMPYSWGFSSNFRTGLGTEDSVERPALINNAAVARSNIIFAGCGGQFLVITGLAWRRNIARRE
jgi:regulator of chromosome condensation